MRLTSAIAALFAVVPCLPAIAVEPSDDASRAKAVLLLTGSAVPAKSATALKAESVLATSGLQVAPAPKEKAAPVELPVSEPLQPCRDGTCYPAIPGFVRGADGVYRQVGVASVRERR